MKARVFRLPPRWQKVWADLSGNKLRTLLVVLSIAVGVFAVGAVYTSYLLFQRDLANSWGSASPASAVRPLARRTASATRGGSPGSGASGRPAATLQKRQFRVHRSPSTMNVAVLEDPQHSWRFGQRASSQTVWRRPSRTMRRTALSPCTP